MPQLKFEETSNVKSLEVNNKFKSNSLRLRDLSDRELKIVLEKIIKLFNSRKTDMETLMVQASSDGRKVTRVEFVEKFVSLDHNFSKERLNGLYTKLDPSMFEEVYITDIVER